MSAGVGGSAGEGASRERLVALLCALSDLAATSRDLPSAVSQTVRALSVTFGVDAAQVALDGEPQRVAALGVLREPHLSVPIIADGAAVGTLDVSGVQRDPVVDAAMSHAAQQLGRVVERTRREQAHHLSGRLLQLQDEERRRTARTLHESAAQTLAALSMNLQRMERMALPPPAAEALNDSLELAAQCLGELRTLSHVLHPPLLDEAGLPSTLRWYIAVFSSQSAIDVDLAVDEALGRLPKEHETALFRVVQESLTNVRRHAGSDHARVQLERKGDEVTLEVTDRGIGIAPAVLAQLRAAPAGVGVGIAGMRERIAQLGGRFEVDSGRDGTRVRAVLRSGR